MKVSELAQLLGFELFGDSEREICGVGFADKACQGELTFAFDERDIITTAADVVVTRPTLTLTDKTLLFANVPIGLAMVKTCRQLAEVGICPDYRCPSSVYLQSEGFYKGEHTIIGAGSHISPGAMLHSDVVIGENCFIGAYSVLLDGVRLGKNVRIGSGCCIGADAFYRYYDPLLRQFEGVGNVMIGDDVSVGNQVTIQRGTLSNTSIGSRTMLGNLVDIGHDVSIGDDCFIVSQCGIAGNAHIGNQVILYGQSGIAGNVHLDDQVVVCAKSLVTKKVSSGQTISGCHSMLRHQELRMFAEMRRLFLSHEKGV